MSEQEQEPTFQEKLKEGTKKTFIERGAGYGLDTTDALYPILIGTWAVIASSQSAAFLFLVGIIFTGLNIAMLHHVPMHLSAAKKLEEEDELPVEAAIEWQQARAIVNQTMGNIGALGVLLGVTIAVILPEVLCSLLGITHPDGMTYFRIAGGVYFLLTGMRWTLASHLRSVGQESYASHASLLMLGLNLIFDPLLMFVAGWGLMGSALGTVIALVVGIAYMQWCIQRKSPLHHIKASWLPTKSVQYKLWVHGGFVILREIGLRVSAFLMLQLIMRLGSAALEAYRLWTTMFLCLFSSVGLAVGTTFRTHVSMLVGKANVSESTKPYQQAYEQDLSISERYCHKLLIRPALWVSLVVTLILSFGYLPLAGAQTESSWYLLLFFGSGIVSWYLNSLSTVLDFGMQGAGKIKQISLATCASETVRLLMTWGIVYLSASVVLDIIGFAIATTLSAVLYRWKLQKVSSGVL